MIEVQWELECHGGKDFSVQFLGTHKVHVALIRSSRPFWLCHIIRTTSSPRGHLRYPKRAASQAIRPSTG